MVMLEKTLESPLDSKAIKPVNPKGNQPWTFIGRTDAEAETPIFWLPHAKSWHWKRPWCWEGLGAGGEGDNQGWDGWMASLTRWMWVWVNSGRWWWTGRPGVLWFMGLQRIGHDWATELNWTQTFNCHAVIHQLCDLGFHLTSLSPVLIFELKIFSSSKTCPRWGIEGSID